MGDQLCLFFTPAETHVHGGHMQNEQMKSHLVYLVCQNASKPDRMVSPAAARVVWQHHTLLSPQRTSHGGVFRTKQLIISNVCALAKTGTIHIIKTVESDTQFPCTPSSNGIQFILSLFSFLSHSRRYMLVSNPLFCQQAHILSSPSS